MLGLPRRAGHDGHDRLGRIDFSGGKSPRCRFYSEAASAVGSVAGQLAKSRGCRAIGSAGSAEKVQFLMEECEFDIAFNYRVGPIVEQLNLEGSDGIDVYFDNLGGEALEAAISTPPQ